MKFLDTAKVYIRSGSGGDVWAEAAENLNTLIDYRFQQHIAARKGGNGMGKEMAGAKGTDAILKVPVGTQIYEEDDATLIADLDRPGARVLLAKGGNGGFGNAHFKSSTNQAPRRANPGQPAEEKTIWLRLKLIADVGLIGLPNAGKSTLLARISAARPKIADYPFTTLNPQLGMVRIGGADFVVADLPGLIEGAHDGAGLGTKFLGHAERTRVIVHLVDGTQAEIVRSYRTIRKELESYGQGLAEKPEVVVLNKTDAIPGDALKRKLASLKRACNGTVFAMSGVTGEGVNEVLYAIAARLRDSAREPSGESAHGWAP